MGGYWRILLDNSPLSENVLTFAINTDNLMYKIVVIKEMNKRMTVEQIFIFLMDCVMKETEQRV